ncbi:MAG TPA: AarF/UbiB family protein [Polyangiaceae bacterium LLY-WYZ-15_(1-7)]|nr:ABC transporter [Myxococcales bacterium]HJK91195.1 AarF/UbiB family protein [Polyangiaceae bacterium LLY-WYZ-15_(1-7)]HJL02913.1 AarF/UbiB family protein [Polyangiaceae bacterium LLY-WYZ-15_(1-7)]HJL09845.1 AarF/UbiB family protein [Polyangiaceae bacterium LLY-WYZ-15_(1-7)]HJL24851.1 AarF/UbiB family protein [Polyangiaceae bacterium LLY-WYZ-15_(1-7)]
MEHTQTRFAPAPSEALPSFTAALKALDAGLAAIERVAWELREAAQAAAESGAEVMGATRDARLRGARLSRAGWMLTKVAASYRLHLTRRAFTSRASAARALPKLHTKNARRFRATSEELGGAFLKVGQMLSTRPDLVPAPWIAELSHLQDAAPPVPFDAIRAVLEEDLGAPLDERFADFDETPLAAASIGQVHRARTHDGREVAVKVQRPGIRTLVEADLRLLEHFLEALAPSLPPTDMDTIVREARAAVLRELDYDHERARMAELAAFLDAVDGVRAPTPFPELSGPRVITASFERGRKITAALDEWAAAREEGDLEAAARLSTALGRVLDAYLRQVLEAGVFQADPHPGNLLVDDAGEVVLLDFGCTQVLERPRRAAYLALFQAFLVNDEAGVEARLVELGFETRSGDSGTLRAFTEALLRDLRGAMAGEHQWPTQEELMAEAARLKTLSEDDPVETLPGDFIMLARVFATLGGLYAAYRPDGLGDRLRAAMLRALA